MDSHLPGTKRRLQMEWRQRTQQYIRDAKAEPCADCHVQYGHWIMDFDHRPGEVKLFDVSKGYRYSRGILDAEIAKCDVICSNCHRTRTYEREMAKLNGQNLNALA